MRSFSYPLVLCLYMLCACTARKLPDYVKTCKRTDPDLSKCWQKAITDLRPYLIKGIPEFEIPSIEPLIIDMMTLNQGDSPTINFQANTTEFKIHGGGAFEIPYAHAEVSNENVLNLVLMFPKLNVEGKYKAKGRVLLFQFESDGKIEGEFINVTANATWHFKRTTRKGKEYYSIDKEHVELDAKKIYLYLHDLFRGNPELTKNVNNAVNENIDVVYNDFKPLMTESLGVVSKKYINRVFDLYPFDVLLPK